MISKNLRFETEPENEILTEIKHNINNYAMRAHAYIENLSCWYWVIRWLGNVIESDYNINISTWLVREWIGDTVIHYISFPLRKNNEMKLKQNFYNAMFNLIILVLV